MVTTTHWICWFPVKNLLSLVFVSQIVFFFFYFSFFIFSAVDFWFLIFASRFFVFAHCADKISACKYLTAKPYKNTNGILRTVRRSCHMAAATPPHSPCSLSYFPKRPQWVMHVCECVCRASPLKVNHFQTVHSRRPWPTTPPFRLALRTAIALLLLVRYILYLVSRGH